MDDIAKETKTTQLTQSPAQDYDKEKKLWELVAVVIYNDFYYGS